MYNQELKEQYLEYAVGRNISIEGWLRHKFDQVQKFESMYKLDLCNFQMEEIVEFYKSLCTTSFNSILIVNSQFGLYTSWCLNRNLVKDHQNHFLEITNEIIQDCVNKALADEKIVTREEVMHMVDEDIPNVSDQFLVLAMFEGLSGKDNSNLCGLLPTDFSWEDNKYYVSLRDERKLNISRELYHLAMDSAETYEMMSEDGETPNRLRYHEWDKEVIKIATNASPDSIEKPRRLYIRILRLKNVVGSPCIDRFALNESGRIDMINRLMKADETSDIDATIRKHRKEIEYRYGKIQSIPQYINRYFGE